MAIVAPSILSADFSRLREEVLNMKKYGADYIHVDVMDGHFVPNITIGPVVLKSISDIDIIFDVHLMISDPKKYYLDFINAGANILTFHYEALDNHLELINLIKSHNVKAGISIKPGTDIKVLEPLLKDLDLVLVMSVEPGFGGQQFLNSALEKIKYLKKMKAENGFNFVIEVDGGINNQTAKNAVEAGCEALVAGTYIFGADDQQSVISELSKL